MTSPSPSRAQYQKQYRLHNKEKIAAYKREYARKNREIISKKQKKWRDSHVEERRKYQAEYYAKNKDRIITRELQYVRQKRINDPVFRNKARVRARIRKLVKSRGGVQSRRTQEILGCDFETLWKYLLFTWKCNYGKEWNGEEYQIDHFIPLAIAKSPEEVEKLCHYSNLQMLTPEDNLKKGDKK